MTKHRVDGYTPREIKLVDRFEELAHAGVAPSVEEFLRPVPRPTRRLRETLQVIALLALVGGGSKRRGAAYVSRDRKAL
ncbi:hypothetical protein JXB37_05890 [candidate division WOR-3 bacterium]|nr:hypothetical protein [candidate division WOR-3 bacterium]